MADSLSTETPPSPSPGMGNALMSGAAPQPQAQPPGSQPGAPGAQPQPAPPTHAQTVAALRHFDAIKRQLELLAKDPALGKSNVKSKIIDGVLQLVATGIMKTTDAVDELAKVPKEPLLQMKWVKSMYAQAKQAENGILDQYGMSQPHFGTVAGHYAATADAANPDDHQDHMSALAANFGGGKQNAG